MALVIEDGSIVTGANSYVTLAEARAYALARGVTLSATDSVVEILAIKSMDYLEMQDFKGDAVDEAQELAWPRAYAYINGDYFVSDDIPEALKKAQMQLMIYYNAGIDPIAASAAAQFVTEDTVGPLTTKYSEAVGNIPARIPLVDNFLLPLLNSGFALRTVRL